MCGHGCGKGSVFGRRDPNPHIDTTHLMDLSTKVSDSNLPLLVFVHGLDHGKHVFNWRACLDVVDGIKDEAAA